MIKKISILLVVTIFYVNICLAKIIKTNDFKVIKDKVQSAESNTSNSRKTNKITQINLLNYREK